MSDRIPVTVAHRWAICAGCGDHRYCHARKVGGMRPVPVCNRCTRAYRRILREQEVLGPFAAQSLLARWPLGSQ